MARPDPCVPDQSSLPLTWVEMMDLALHQAFLAGASGEAPVGAVLLDPSTGTMLAQAHNAPIARNDPTAHAEILCLRNAAKRMGNYRVPGTIMAVTLEPCTMCVGALVHARVAGVVVGTPDPRTGALFTNLDGARLPWGNHKMWVVRDILSSHCSNILREFFRSRR
ncbi:tRNA(adenine34) deaminase [Paucidesulfovibrio gracilis DSM 16080]|uniref:tRNA-specific adenosine deaminase n=1 Tax=Paucidesulfovibrio gracilis DSM 16080 TaxID=1121449 RepID=A0A1T4WLU1_9BACT|nr:nucleoside deaminase [Paucidesulfovibrio gracilis]SKA78302.1 tRNA(adenine34) deaminase [Paucidesulfovibrio gracilis DSM 16080]